MKRYFTIDQIGLRLGLKRSMVTSYISKFEKELKDEVWKCPKKGAMGFKWMLTEQGIQMIRGFKEEKNTNLSYLLAREIQALKRDILMLKAEMKAHPKLLLINDKPLSLNEKIIAGQGMQFLTTKETKKKENWFTRLFNLS